MQQPMTTHRNQLWKIRNLVNCDETNPECPCCPCLLAFVARGNMSEAMEVASVAAASFDLPGAVGLLDLFAVTENAIVINDYCIFADIEANRCRSGIVGVLYQLVGKRSISLKIT
jgi:hypothetical protein